MKLLAVVLVILGACGGAQRSSGAGVDAWVPADVVMVILVREGAALDAIDALAVEMRAPSPKRHVATPAVVADAWSKAGVRARGAAWMLLEGDAATTAACAQIERGDAAAALVSAGGKASRAGDAAIVDLAEVAVVVRDGVACSVTSGVASRRALAAARLATLAADERLALPPVSDDAAVIVRGAGDVIAGGLAGELPLGELGAPTIELAADAGTLRIDVRAPAIVAASSITVSPGAYAAVPAPEPLERLPLPDEDLNPDVPESAEYRAGVATLVQTLAEAAHLAQEIAAREDAARAAWIDAWGTAQLARTAGHATVTWTYGTRARADAALDAALAGVEGRRLMYFAKVEIAKKRISELVKLRARDVAAYDRAQPR